MKIEKFKKMKNGMYEIEFDNFDKLLVFEEVILKYDLLLIKTVDDNKIKKIKDLNDYYNCYYKALRLINKKAYTKKELFQKLKRDDIATEDINKVISELEQQGYINDQVFSNSYVHSKIITTTHGPNRIRKDLIDKGVANIMVEIAMEQYNEEVEREKISKIIKKKISCNHNKSNNYLKRKLKNELVFDGFNVYLVDQIILNTNFKDDSFLREKEYNKIKNTLSKKYNGKDLEYKIKEKMASKGFY